MNKNGTIYLLNSRRKKIVEMYNYDEAFTHDESLIFTDLVRGSFVLWKFKGFHYWTL